MGTFWHKPAYVAADRDADGEIRADALRPGIYCQDEAALAQLRRGAHEHSRMMIATQFGWSLEGQAVYLCTPAQAEFFRATATKGPPPEPEHDPLAEVVEKAAEMRRLMEAAERVKDSVYGPDGKIDVGGRMLCLRGIGPREYGRHVARHTETEVDFTATLERMTPAVRAMAEPQHPFRMNRAARRAAAAQARRRS